MKVASFNINDINRRLTNLFKWLGEAEPDIVCLQELKAADAEFPAKAIRERGYHAVWRGEKRWNGVAILARWAPVVTRLELPGDATDRQSRYLEAAINGVIVASIYAPNGNPQPGPKFEYKLAWLKRLADHAAYLYASGAPVVLAGDFNVVPTDLDIYPTKSWDRDALLQPESRAAYRRILSQGWSDAIRALHPREPMYTFWDYKRSRWERVGGLRLDQFLLSPVLTERLQEAAVDRHVRGIEGASDHAPVWVKLRNAANPLRVSTGHTSRHASTAGMTALPQANKATTTGNRTGRRSRVASAPQPALSGRPLLVIDGDSFAHRSYHALPKTIRRSDGNGAGAILGFANFLIRIYGDEHPRAVVLGWDTLDAPTKRREMFPAYQSGREFAEDLIEQLCACPNLLLLAGLQTQKPQGSKRMTFLPLRLLRKSALAGSRWWRVVIEIPFSSPRNARRSSTLRGAAKLRASGRTGSGSDMASIRNKYPTSLPFVAILPTDCLGQLGLGQHAPLNWAAVGFADRRARRRTFSNSSGNASPLLPHRYDGCVCAVALAGRSEAEVGFSIESCARLGAESVG
jgi:exodeoxyribonuclease-3